VIHWLLSQVSPTERRSDAQHRVCCERDSVAGAAAKCGDRARARAARSVVLCEAMGLWAVAHADGTVLLRMLPAGALAERQTLALARGAPPAVYNDSEFRAPFLARAPRTPDDPQG
jgi:hypothetical protein